MACKECENRGKTWEGGDPICAFDTDDFYDGNWMCASMNKLRILCEDRGYFNRDDNANASIGVLPIPECDEASGYLVMTWYKSRGRTGKAVTMCDDSSPLPLTAIEAEAILRGYSKQEVDKSSE